MTLLRIHSGLEYLPNEKPHNTQFKGLEGNSSFWGGRWCKDRTSHKKKAKFDEENEGTSLIRNKVINAVHTAHNWKSLGLWSFVERLKDRYIHVHHSICAYRGCSLGRIPRRGINKAEQQISTVENYRSINMMSHFCPVSWTKIMYWPTPSRLFV